MTAICPAGHESQADDYCDVCGEQIVPAVTPSTPDPEPAAFPAGTLTCANCGSPRAGRFCEACGYDSALPTPAAPAGPSAAMSATAEPDQAEPAGTGWSVTVRADRAWYTRALSRGGPDAGAVPFPPYFAERRFRLTGPEMMIGKHDRAEGIQPGIDLRVQPEDVGISRTQAVLRQTGDGGWEVVDIGSTNGTVVGDGTDPIIEFTPVPLLAGDEFHIGAWTTVTLVRD